MTSGLRDSAPRGGIAGSLPHPGIADGQAHPGIVDGQAQRAELQAAIAAALDLADALCLSMVGIHLDQARVELARAAER